MSRALVLVGAVAGLVAFGGPPRAAGADSTAAVAAHPDSGPMDRAHVVAVERDAAPPAPDYVALVRSGFTPESRAYSTTRAVLGFTLPLYDVAVCLILLFSGASRRMRDIADAMGHHPYVRSLVYVALLGGAWFVLTFPYAWYEGFALERQYGLSTQGFGDWLFDRVVATLVAIVGLGIVPVVRYAFAIIGRSPRRWWLWLAAGTLPLIAVSALLEPLVVDPLFNRFTPVRDAGLAQEILALAGRAGIPAHDVWEVDRSAQTRTYNAYVNGIGASHRIVLWDTTLKGMRRDEILFVMGHEMGHYVLRHVWKGIVLVSLASVALFFVCDVLMRRALARFGARWGVTGPADLAALPLLLATLTVVSLLAQPAVNLWSRRIEHEADVFGLEVTGQNDAAARAFIKVAAQNRSDPEPAPVVKWFQYSHPPLLERIRFAASYHPWAEGRPNRLFHGR